MRPGLNIIPTLITSLRIIGALALIFLVPFTKAFYAVYVVCGVSDVLDGFVARRFGWTSDIGSKIDSFADLFFYAVVLVRTFPVLWATLPGSIWIILGVVLMLRLILYIKYAVIDHEFGHPHTYLNKFSSFTVFFIILVIKTKIAIVYCYISVFIALAAVLYELFIRSKILSKQIDTKSSDIKNRS
jgi:CDP-diacylglycerol--glycerol-3-phosphate 3-phosphatidyltransferase